MHTYPGQLHPEQLPVAPRSVEIELTGHGLVDDVARKQGKRVFDETLSRSAHSEISQQPQMDNPAPDLLDDMYALLTDVVSLPAIDQGYLHSLYMSIASARASENSKAPLSLLPLLSCQAAGGELRYALPVAAAWRAIHLAAKLLDDVQDGDTAGHSSTANSINKATGFFSAAGLALLRLNPVVQSAVLPSFYKTILIMSSGQHTEAARSVSTLEDYMNLISAKSGRFFALATSCGASCGTDNQSVVSLLDDFGFNVGIFIQIADDYLDWHNAESADIASGAPTLPLCFIRTVGTADQQARLDQLLGRSADFDDLKYRSELQKLASEVGAESYMLAEMVRHKVRALAALDELDKLALESHNTKPLREWFNRFSAFAPA